MPFRVFGVFRGSNQKLRSAPDRCGADLFEVALQATECWRRDPGLRSACPGLRWNRPFGALTLRARRRTPERRAQKTGARTFLSVTRVGKPVPLFA